MLAKGMLGKAALEILERGFSAIAQDTSKEKNRVKCARRSLEGGNAMDNS